MVLDQLLASMLDFQDGWMSSFWRMIVPGARPANSRTRNPVRVGGRSSLDDDAQELGILIGNEEIRRGCSYTITVTAII